MSSRPSLRRLPAGAAALATLSLVLTLANPALAQTRATPVTFDIPAQALGSALLALGQQANLEVSFVPTAVAGKSAPALHGTLSPLDALDQLLRGSGLALRSDGPGRYIIYVDKTNQFSALRLDAVKVYGEHSDERVYTQEEIATTPTANQDLTSLVATHPAVRTNATANGSTNRGSMNVEDISFHGSSPYQNLFQIDGMDATNRVDPASKNLNLQIGNIPSNSQSYFVDTNLLGEVRVMDSFVPVEYGRFTGGVVDARLRRPTGENHLQLDYRWNTSKMTQQKIAEGDENGWGQGKPGFSPEWKKRFYTAIGDIAINDKTGAVLSMSRRESSIRRWNMGVAADQPTQGEDNYTDRIDNFLGKFTVRATANTISDLTLKYSDRRETLASDTFRNTQWDNTHAARGIGWNLDHAFQGGRASVQAGWDNALSNRSSDATELVTHKFPSIPLFTTGGYGKEQKEQDTWTLKGRIDLDTMRTGPFTHTPYAGIDVQRVAVNFERFSDSYSYIATHLPNGTERQASKVHNIQGTVATKYNTASVYLSDRVELGRVAFTGALRADRETFLNNTNVSPRTRLDWDAFGDGNTVVSGGWARYYGSDVLNIALEERINTLRRQVLDRYGNPVADGSKPYYVSYEGLRTPYDDEWALSVRQRMGSMEGVAAYVHRNGRDQVSKSGDSVQGYRYLNDGKSTTDTISLTLRTLEPWRLMDTRWTARADWSYQKRKVNADLVEGYEGGARDPDEYILYDGERMRAIDRPPTSFYQPQKASVSLTGIWPKAGLTWDNSIQWRSSRMSSVYVGYGPRPESLQSYRSARLASYWTWDTRLIWEPTFARNVAFTVDVLNVLNKTPAITATNPNLSTNRSTYQVGREIWVQASYRF